MVLSFIYMILATVVLASIVPCLQYIAHLMKNKVSTDGVYCFSQELLNYDTSKSGNSISIADRVELANRGWVRCPNGTIMTEQEFEEKKRIEYSIELP